MALAMLTLSKKARRYKTQRKGMTRRSIFRINFASVVEDGHVIGASSYSGVVVLKLGSNVLTPFGAASLSWSKDEV